MREFGPETYPVGEVGILEDVHKSTENYCYLVITYNGSRYVGVIQCDDQDFFKKLYRHLTDACGHPVRRARHRSKLMDHTTTPQVGFAQLRFVGRTTDCARSGASDGTFSGTIYGRSVLPEPRKEQERARLQQFAQI